LVGPILGLLVHNLNKLSLTIVRRKSQTPKYTIDTQ
jgi:hypothetical protein